MGSDLNGLGLPGIGRVVFGFLLTAGLALGVAYALRRWLPMILQRKPVTGVVRALGRTAVSRTLTVHLVEIEGIRLVIAEGRAGVALTVMPAGPPPSPATGTTFTSMPISPEPRS